jgi:hypothetical protein
LALNLAATAVVDEDLQVHLRLAAKLVDVTQKLALVGANGLAQDFIVAENGSKSEGKHRGVLEAIRDDPGVVYAGLLIQCFLRVVLTDDDCKITGGIKKYLISAYSKD